MVDKAPRNSFMEMVSCFIEKLAKCEVSTLMALIWTMWLCRNELVMEHKEPRVGVVASGFARLVHDYCEYELFQVQQKLFVPRPLGGLDRMWEW